MRAAPRRGAHRRKRPRRALPGTAPGRLAPRAGPPVGIGDDATSEIYSAFFVDEEGTMSIEVIRELSARRRPGATTGTRPRPAARWSKPTQVGRARSSHRADRGLFARGQGALRAHVRDCRNAFRLAGITEMAEANRFLRELYLPLHSQPRLRLRALRRRARRRASATTTPCATTSLQARHHYVKKRVHEYPDGTLALTAPRQRRRRAHRQPNPAGRVIRFDAARRCPVDKWTSAPDHFPTGPTTSTEAVNSFGT